MVETEKNLGLEKENEKTGNVSKVKNLEMALIADAKSDNFEENNFINYSLACSPEIIIQEVSWFSFLIQHSSKYFSGYGNSIRRFRKCLFVSDLFHLKNSIIYEEVRFAYTREKGIDLGHKARRKGSI